MITEPAFEHPDSLNSLLQRAEARLAMKERLPDLELALIIEGFRGMALPAVITNYLTQHFRGEIRAVKGPKLQSDAEKDFRFGQADNLYRRALPIFEYFARRQKRRASKRRIANSTSNLQDEALTPSKRALGHVIKTLKNECELQMISARSLANAISERHRKIEEREFPFDEPNMHPTDEQESF
jgi:hypothetical protein